MCLNIYIYIYIYILVPLDICCERAVSSFGGSCNVDCVWNVTRTCAETIFRLSARNGPSPFKSAGGGRQFSRLLAAEVCGISGSNAGYTVFWGSVKGTGYPLHSPVSPSLPLPCVTVCHHISTGVYLFLCCCYTGRLFYLVFEHGKCHCMFWGMRALCAIHLLWSRDR